GVGNYSPYSLAGRRLIAHELAHVLQQRGSATATPDSRVGNRGHIQRQQDDRITATFGCCSAESRKTILDIMSTARDWVRTALTIVWAVLRDVANASKSRDIEHAHAALNDLFKFDKRGPTEDVFSEVVTIYRNL